tara:strand:- start:3027 stop:3449 length:423 start_codon:yes stop_codon:yes gene_type:complete
MIDYEVIKGDSWKDDRSMMAINGRYVAQVQGEVVTLSPFRVTSDYYMRKVNTFLKEEGCTTRVVRESERLRLKLLDCYSADEPFWAYLDCECGLADARIYEVNEADEDYASYDEELGDRRDEFPSGRWLTEGMNPRGRLG